MFQKIMDIVGALAVVAVIVMVALSPRASGFFPNALDFLNRKTVVGVEGVEQIEADSLTRHCEPAGRSNPDIIPPMPTTEGSPSDTLFVETQNDTLTHN